MKKNEALELRSPSFHLTIDVMGDHIDDLGHVNNQVYLEWFMRAAIEHSRSVGMGLEEYRALGGVFVVRRNEIHYHYPAVEGDRLVLETWTSGMQGARSKRHYELTREDGRKIASGETDWVFVDVKTMKPAAIPQEISSCFFGKVQKKDEAEVGALKASSPT